MDLLRFVATNVYGYLDFDIEFNKDLSFIVGVNGSGKTTVIRLIQALLTASARELNLIEFKRAALEVADDRTRKTISAEVTSDTIEVKVSSVPEPLSIQRVDPYEIEDTGRESASGTTYFDEINIQISQTPVGKELSSLEAPVILGLERRAPRTVSRDRSFWGRRTIHSLGTQRGKRRIFRGTLGASLMDTEAIVQDAYRRLRMFQDRHNDTLRQQILLSAFRYVPIASLQSIEITSPESLSSILGQRAEIEKRLPAFEAAAEELTGVMGEFFRNLGAVIERIRADSNDFDSILELVINKAQIDRIMGLIGLVDEHESRMERAMLRITRFLDTVNAFYADTGKELGIDTVGHLEVKAAGRPATSIEALSSGERQLLIIFANLLFGAPGEKRAFVIDEPELSLHLKWQGAFIDSMLKASPGTQLIVATHSPEIVGDHKEKAIALGGASR
jgi:predicted ATPase